MIIKKLQYLRTRIRQVPTNIPLDKLIGSHYNSDMEEVSTGYSYNIVNNSSEHVPYTSRRLEAISISFPTIQKANEVANLPDRNFSYHDFNVKRPDIDTKYIYNYEFVDYENLSREATEMNLPSGLLWSYLGYFGAGYSLQNDIRSLGTAIPIPSYGPAGAGPLQVSARLGDEDNEVFDKRSQMLGAEPKKYENNYYREYVHRNQNQEISYNEDWQKKQKNIFIMYNQTKDIDYLPNCVTFKISSQKDIQPIERDTISEVLNENELSKFLFLYIKRQEPIMVNFFNSVDEKEISLKTWNLMEWLESDDFSEMETMSDEIVLYDRNDPDLAGLRRYLPRRFRKVLALAQIRNYLKGAVLRFEDIIETKKKCRSSVLGYKVEKSLTEGGTSIQTFYLEGRINNFIDTQIGYDKRYFYKVSELRVVIGGEYSYKTEKEGPFLPSRVKVEFESRPSVRVVENHVQTFAYKISTPPLYSPDIIIANEQFVKNKVKFYVSDFIGNTVKHTEQIEKVLESDVQFYNNLRMADFINDDGLARFFSRSNTGNFEVFRIDTKPQSYEDFAQGFVGTFNNYEEFKVDQEKHAAYIDYIQHEKTYYYMFRSLDHHGNPGKPSYVFEVFLIEDADEVLMRYDAYDLYKEKEKYATTKTFRKYIQIVPAYKHLPFKEDDPNMITSVENIGSDTSTNSLGITEGESLWDYNDSNSYVKLRITSKKTGKKFDLNLRFKQTKN